MHSHNEIDIISVILEGAVQHEGSLEHGQSLVADQVQVQRAGGEGFSHNEINPNETRTRMLQIWVLPEKIGEATSYKVFNLKKGHLTHIYGGEEGQNDTLPSHTNIEIGILSEHQEIKKDGEFLAYITNGAGYLNDIVIKDDTLVSGTDLHFKAIDNDVHITIVSNNEN